MSQVAPSSGRLRSTRKGALSPREKAFILAYIGEANLDGVKAATLAGCVDPSSAAWRYLRRPRIRAAIDRRIAGRIAGPQEVMGKLSQVATAPWKDFVKVVMDDEGHVIAATVDLTHQLKAADLLLKAHGTYLDPLTRALGKLAMLEVSRMMRAKRVAAKNAKNARLSRHNPKQLAQSSTVEIAPPVVDEVEAEVLLPSVHDVQGKARQDD